MWAYGASRTATVLATLLLVFVLGGDLLFYGGMGLLPGSARPAILPAPGEAIRLERAEAIVEVEKAIESQADIVLEKPVESAAEAEPSATPAMKALRAPQTETVFGEAGEETAPAVAAQEAPREGVGTVTAQRTQPATPAPEPTNEALAHALPTEPAASPPAVSARPSQTEIAARRLRYIEFSLLGVIVVLVCATLILRRRVRKF
jgi:hypothetical protein